MVIEPITTESARGHDYGAVGAVVAAAALRSLARPASVLDWPGDALSRRAFSSRGLRAGGGAHGRQAFGRVLPRPAHGSFAERQPRLGGRGPVVGRRAELSVLATALRDLAAGRGSLVLVVGEPGLGKTRLIQECRKRFMSSAGPGTGGPPLWLEGRCASYAATTPYSLYQHVLAGWAGVAPDQDQTVVARALEQALRAVVDGEDLWPILARMMGLSTAPGFARMTPQELQRETFSALRAVVPRLISLGPTLMMLEDLHWADPTSLRLSEDLATLASEGPLLVLGTTRPDARAELAGLADEVATKGGYRPAQGRLRPAGQGCRAGPSQGAGRGRCQPGCPRQHAPEASRAAPCLEERYFSLGRDEGSIFSTRAVGAWLLRWVHRSPRSWAPRAFPGRPAHPGRARGEYSVLPLCSDRSWAFPSYRPCAPKANSFAWR